MNWLERAEMYEPEATIAYFIVQDGVFVIIILLLLAHVTVESVATGAI